MPAQLLMVGNPARRKTKRKSRKAPSAAQLAARAKFAAMARARSKKAKAHKRPARTALTTTTRSNPVNKRRAAPKRAHAAARRRVRRNPISSTSLRNITGQLKAAFGNAAGALGVDVVAGYIQGTNILPAAIATPRDAAGAVQYGYFAFKGALAIGLAMIAGKVIGANKAGHIAAGSLTVTAHELLKTVVPATVPMGMYTGPSNGVGLYLNNSPGGRVLPPMRITQQLRGANKARTNMAEREAFVH